MQHALLSAYGSRWRQVHLAMYTSFIDDSGTDPKQAIAIASALLIPAKKLEALESEWNTFREKEGIPDFHTSECVARNRKSCFADWDDERVQKVLKRVQQIGIKYSVKGLSIAINKVPHDEKVPSEVRVAIGNNHYSYAVDAAIGKIFEWARERNVQMEYVFDNIDPKTQKVQRREIDRVMMNAEEMYPGSFAGHYSFRHRKEVPALQCADLFAWTCYQQACAKVTRKPLSEMAAGCWSRFDAAKSRQWCGFWLAVPKTYQDMQKIKFNYARPVLSIAKPS